MLKLQTMLFKVNFKLRLVAQSKNKMHFILNFNEVVQSPIKIWVSERKRMREQEIGCTNSSFKSELKHLWVKHKNCHFRSPAWCIKHTQEPGLAHSFPWHCRSLWRTQSTLGRRRAPFQWFLQCQKLSLPPFCLQPGPTGMSDKESWEVLLMPGGCPRRKWRSCYN